MRRGQGVLFGGVICGLLLAGARPEVSDKAVSTAINVLPADLLVKPPAANWTSYNGDYTGRRYSSLSQITPSNVGQLRTQWVFHARNSDHLEVTPVVVNGVMFVTAANDAFALDARTGRTIWRHSRQTSEGLIDDAARHLNRGVALWHDRVYMETDNAHLLCLEARSGNLVWDIAYADWNKNYGATSAPLVVKDKVIVGTSGGDEGVRGFVAAYDAQTGKLAWRFWTIPAPGEFGSESWPGGDLYLHGGGTTWMPGTYDPELNTLFWGTSNPAPDYDGSVRPGDNLYTDCLLALDADTGKLKWYFQFTPHDLFDFDATETPILIDTTYRASRKLVVQANRNGYIYVLDRTNGKFLSAAPFVEKLNWARGIDAKGRPVRTDVKPTPEGTKVCPGYRGATNWYSPSYNESTRLVYFMALEGCQTYFSSEKPQRFEEGKSYYSTGVKRIAGENSQKLLVAYNLERDTIAWKYPQIGPGQSSGGTMTTAGGVVFFGDDAESFEGVNAQSGQPLWHFNTGQDMSASPMSYAIHGKQYVAIAAGSDIFSFALP